MPAASIEVSGLGAQRSAAQLRAVLTANTSTGDSVSAVEVERSAELIVSIIGLVFSGPATAKTIWDRWHSRQEDRVTVRIIMDDGSRIELSGVDEQQLTLEFERRTNPSA